MKKASIHQKIVTALLVLCLGAGGIWALRRERLGTPAKAAEKPADVLAAIPPPAGNSATDQAITKSMQKVRQNANDDRTWVNLGDALMQKVRETVDQGYYAHAQKAFEKALALNPKNADAMTGLAWVSGGRHEFDKSIEWANKAIALDARNHAAHGLLGDAQVESGDYAAAFEHYQKMLDIRPDISSYSRGAHLLFLTGDTRKATWLMAKAIKAGGPYAENTAWCRAQLALMLWNTGALLPAQQVLSDALEKTPNNHHVLAAMGKVKAANKDYKAAIDFYKKAVAIAPEHGSLVALGDLYRITGDKNEAEKQYARVEKLHQQSHAGGVQHSDTQLAQFYADHDRSLIEALRMAEQRKLSNNVFDADTLAWCYYKNGRYEPAKNAIQRALRQKTPDAKILFHAGMIHAKLGERPAARDYLHRALSLNPNFSPLDAPVAAETLKQLGQVAGNKGI